MSWISIHDGLGVLRRISKWRYAPAGEASTEAGSTLVRTSSVHLVLLAILPVGLAMWAMLSPAIVLSNDMTWDFVYNLSGAWHLWNGQAEHLDFHDPLGLLSFLPTLFGFELVGLSPAAFLVGASLVSAVAFVSAALAAMRRLPLVPAAFFVVFVSLLPLRPANVGESLTAYTFAMSYNRYGWSLLAVLTLILFVPPRDDRRLDLLDTAIAGLLLTAFFYLKITYFAAGLALAVLAAIVSPHVRHRPAVPMIMAALIVLNAVAPWNHAYLADILDAVEAGAVRSKLTFHVNNFFTNVEASAAYVAAVLFAAWLWWRGLASLRLPVAVAGIFVVALFVLSQNHQTHGLPAAIVIAFLLYDHLRRRSDVMASAAPVLMIFPLFVVAASAISIWAYHVRAQDKSDLQVVAQTNLKGLAVPIERSGLLDAFAAGKPSHALLNWSRALQPHVELTATEYVDTIIEAAHLLADGQHRPGGVVVLDQVNPFPFMLGWVPPRGGNLWSATGAPVRPASEVFADADYVLIPKFSTDAAWTERAAKAYTEHLSKHYPKVEDTRSWAGSSPGRHPPPVSRRALIAGAAALATPAVGRDQPRLQSVNLLLDWQPTPTYAGFFLAREWGLFAHRGLEVALFEGRGAVVSTQMVAFSSEYWIGVSSGVASAIGRSQGLPIKSLSVLYRNTPSVIFSRAERGIVVPTDLYGRRIGLVPGSVTVEEFRAFLAAQHLDPARIATVSVEPAAAPLLDGRVDALIDYEENLPSELRADGRQISVLRLADAGVQLYSLNIIAREEAWVSPDTRSIAIRVVEAVQEAYSRLQFAPAAAIAAFAPLYPAFSRPYLSQAMSVIVRQLGHQPLGQQTREGWQATVDQLARLGLLARPVTPDEVAGDLLPS
ncbi:MAG: ABC transporter substrate-binding protein [Reyranella sp.]|uniref:ABC transporter substrate-binding protein n=1 Tax=Reyranella sp. TaxID=1929291 RepID=UPI003D106E3E